MALSVDYYARHPEELKTQEDVLSAIKTTGSSEVLTYVDKSFMKNKEFILEAIGVDYTALRFAPEQLKEDKDVVLAAIVQDGTALQWAAEGLQNDKTTATFAVNKTPSSFVWVGEELQSDRELAFLIVSNGKGNYIYLSDELKNSDFGQDLRKAIDNNTYMSFKSNYSFYFRPALQNLNDESLGFNDCLKSLTNEDLKDSRVVDALIERFSQYECSKDFDLNFLKLHPQESLGMLKGFNFQQEELIKSNEIELQ